MKADKPYGLIVEVRADGTERIVAKLTVDEYEAMERAMQWPEDLAKWDRLHTPIEAGLGKNGLVFLNI